MKTTELVKRNIYLLDNNGKENNVEVTFVGMCGNAYRLFWIENGLEVYFQCDAEFVEKHISVMPIPSIGQYVFDTYYNCKKQVKGIANGLFYIGSDHEPVHRHEFVFPLPTNK